MVIKMEQVFHKVILTNRIYKAIEVNAETYKNVGILENHESASADCINTSQPK